VVAGVLSLFCGEPDGGGLGGAEEDLGYGGGGGVGAPGCGVDGLAGGAGADDVADDAGLVFALVGAQCVAIDVADGV
jgi:hypothetical protein